MNATQILKMIEDVDYHNKHDLDVLEANVWFYIFAEQYAPSIADFWDKQNPDKNIEWVMERRMSPQYTRSRDALKGIRPKDYMLDLVHHGDEYVAKLYARKNIKFDKTSPKLPAEELAELHAIIQAIEYERNIK